MADAARTIVVDRDCPACGGMGNVVYGSHESDARCNLCHGRGIVEVEVKKKDHEQKKAKP